MAKKVSPRKITKKVREMAAGAEFEQLVTGEVGMIRKGFREFRQFIVRGNVVDLAIAVVIGAAFNAVVQALVKDIITPLIGAVGGQPDFSRLHFTLHKSIFNYGDFLNSAVSFLILATVVFFFVVQPVNRLMRTFKRDETAEVTTRDCPECLSDIPIKATRCKYCTAKSDPSKPEGITPAV